MDISDYECEYDHEGLKFIVGFNYTPGESDSRWNPAEPEEIDVVYLHLERTRRPHAPGAYVTIPVNVEMEIMEQIGKHIKDRCWDYLKNESCW